MGKPNRQSAIGNRQFKRFVPALLNWFSANARDLPWRRTRDPYPIWVSEIMLQQTQVKTVIPYWERWMRELPTIKAAANARPAKVHKLWEGLGYYTRARNLQKAAKQIVKMHNGKLPVNFAAVLALPGIGRYTAGAICSIAFNQPTPILDGNVVRVLTRVFGIAANPKEKETNAQLWKLAETLVRLAEVQSWGATAGEPAREHAPLAKNKNCSHFNQSLMELGAMVCTPRNPRCKICPAQKLCVAFRENCVADLPNLGKREAATASRFAAFVVERNGRFLVRQRPDGVVNGHLWEFPNAEIGARFSEPRHERVQQVGGEISAAEAFKTHSGSQDPDFKLIAEVARRALGFVPSNIQPLCSLKHSITRYRITLEAFRVNCGAASRTSLHSGLAAKSDSCINHLSAVGIWKTPAQLQKLAFSSAHKRILRQLIVPK